MVFWGGRGEWGTASGMSYKIEFLKKFHFLGGKKEAPGCEWQFIKRHLLLGPASCIVQTKVVRQH